MTSLDEPLHVCVVAPGVFTHGGVPYVVRNTVTELANRGVKVWVLTDDTTEPGAEIDAGENVTRIHLSRSTRMFPVDVLSFSLRSLPKIRSLNRSVDLDIIHVHGSYAIVGAVARLLHKLDAEVIETVHGTYLNELRAFRQYPVFENRWRYFIGVYLDHLIQRVATTFSDRVHAVSENTKEELVDLGYEESAIKAVPNGINFSEFVNERVDHTVAEQYDISVDPIVLSLGSVVPRKGIHTLIAAFELVLREHPSAQLVHVGGTPHDGYSQYIKRSIAERGLEDHVTLTGNVSRSAVLGWLDQCDVYVSASFSEGCSISLLEAAANSNTVVATDVGGAREVLGHYGIYVEPGNPEEVANGIIEAFETDIGEKLRNRIETEMTWEILVHDIYEIYMECTR